MMTEQAMDYRCHVQTSQVLFRDTMLLFTLFLFLSFLDYNRLQKRCHLPSLLLVSFHVHIFTNTIKLLRTNSIQV